MQYFDPARQVLAVGSVSLHDFHWFSPGDDLAGRGVQFLREKVDSLQQFGLLESAALVDDHIIRLLPHWRCGIYESVRPGLILGFWPLAYAFGQIIIGARIVNTLQVLEE